MDIQPQLFRDGTSQADRVLAALEPGSISVDEQTVTDWLQFAQAYGRHLTYFNGQNQPDGDWSAFFAGDPQVLAAAVAAIAPQLEPGSGSATSDETTLADLALPPQLALFLTFLKLLQYPQQQFHALTQRRLDFYYRRVLGLLEQPTRPDRTHVIFSLNPNASAQLLSAGTHLAAGQDAQGNERIYATETDLLVTPAQVASLQSLAVQTQTIDLEALHRQTGRDAAGFAQMLRWALGRPNRGDPLPLPPGEMAAGDTLTALLALHDEIRELRPDQVSQDIQDYVLKGLCFTTLAEFNVCLATHQQAQQAVVDAQVPPPHESEWQQVYRLLTKANRKKLTMAHRDRLQQAHQQYVAEAAQAHPLLSPDHAFLQLWRLALGEPTVGDRLPPFQAPPEVDLNALLQAVQGPTPEAAERFIQTELWLGVADFIQIMAIQAQFASDLTAPEWAGVYRRLDQAQRQKRGWRYPPLERTELQAIQAQTIAQMDLETGSPPVTLAIPRFHPFLPNVQIAQTHNALTQLGLAIASPRLHLEAGQRQITLTLACQASPFPWTELTDWLDQQLHPFQLALSSASGWLSLEPDDCEVAIGDFCLEPAIKTYGAETLIYEHPPVDDTADFIEPSQVRLSPDQGSFTPADRGTVIAWSNGTLYEIVSLLNPQAVFVQPIGHLQQAPSSGRANPEPVRQYAANHVSLQSLQVVIRLGDRHPAIAPLPATTPAAETFPTHAPLLKLTLADPDNNAQAYKVLQTLSLTKIKLQVAVQGLNTLQLRDERTVLNPQSPFTPFGLQPSPGQGFYFAHPELVGLPLDRLSVNLTWLGLPHDFARHYAAYDRLGSTPGLDNQSFRAKLSLVLQRQGYDLGEQSLFNADGGQLLATAQLHTDRTAFDLIDPERYTGQFAPPTGRDLFSQAGYFRLELSQPDFQHARYPLVLNQLAFNQLAQVSNPELQTLSVEPPYTPKLQGITVDYQATVEIDLLDLERPHAAQSPTTGQVFQLEPFGFRAWPASAPATTPATAPSLLKTGQGDTLLPQYEAAGTLFIGLRGVKPPQSLTLLFQVVAGSGNTDVTPPMVTWSYWAGDRWHPFGPREILADSTQSLLDSGILHLAIPAAATVHHQRRPQGLHWLRATVAEAAAALPEILAIHSQAVTATLLDSDQNAPPPSQPLPAASIQALVEPLPAIAQVAQPYSAFGGRPPERDRHFYTRVSERLRHKQRALTRWDYEHLVLGKFPQIYKVKCLTQAEQAQQSTAQSTQHPPHQPHSAQVTLVVIPNLADTVPFLPLEPKAPQALLREIEAYLQARTSPFVNIVAKNPRYEQIKYRVAVRFHSVTDQGYFLQQLNQELVQFLSPWAYAEHRDIPFGSRVHRSAIIHFLETRPYVDYVANLKLIEQVSLASAMGARHEPTYRVNPTHLAQVSQADAILVSAPEHIIDPITTSDYEAAVFEGIDYMRVGVDFRVV
ncbi:MAG: hypothetical protein AAGG51_20160 [Cyanobacteria bacterium P01_G01_bin.54]